MAGPLALAAGCTVEQGFAQIAAHCLAQIRANEAGLKRSEDPEFVHQMRVGLRRLRSAQTLFKRWIRLPDELTAEIRWLGQVLGAARDAEVLAGTTLPALLQDCPEPGLQRLQRAAAAVARKRRRAAVAAIDSARYLALMKHLQDWLGQQGWRSDSPRPSKAAAALRPAAARLLRRRRKAAQALALALQARAPAADRHALRIAVKKMRYAAEFFSAFASPKASARLGRLSDLQDLLGQLNDADVGAELLRTLEQAQPALLGPAAFARGLLWAQARHRIKVLYALLPPLLA